MGKAIDVSDLPPEKVKIVEEFVEFLKTRGKKEKTSSEHVAFASWSLGVKGKLTREKIYEHL